MKIHYSESRNDFETSQSSHGRSCVRSSTATNGDIMSAYELSATISKP